MIPTGKQQSLKPYPWCWMEFSEEGKTCSKCGCLTTTLFGRNPNRLPPEETRISNIVLVDAAGVCLSCVPRDEVADNPNWYEE